MKKEYLKPEMDVMEFLGEVLMLDASGEHDSTVPGGEDDGSGFSNDRRGGWGDLWN